MRKNIGPIIQKKNYKKSYKLYIIPILYYTTTTMACPISFLNFFDSVYFSIHHTAQFIWSDIHGKSRSSVKPPNIKMSKKERKEVQNSQGKLGHTKI